MVTTAVLYVRVSTAAQATYGASLKAQERLLAEEATSRGWDYRLAVDAGQSAKNLNRPAIQYVLDTLDRGEAQHLMALRVDRIARSVSDFSDVLDRSLRQGWDMIFLSPEIDTSTVEGRHTARLQAEAAEYESVLMGLRTKEGMAQRTLDGVKMGRPRSLPDDVRRLIVSARARGKSLRAIADYLNTANVATAQSGKRWYASTIKAILDADLTATR